MVKTTLYEIMPKLSVERFEAKDGTDFAYSIPNVARFRVNVMRQLNAWERCSGPYPRRRNRAELKLPEAVMNLCKINNGLILVTGKTGSGNRRPGRDDRRHQHAREGAHPHHRGPHRVRAHAQAVPHQPARNRRACAVLLIALLSALREDPDVILVGELRDLETMSIAVTAAEMGILVMALCTPTAPRPPSIGWSTRSRPTSSRTSAPCCRPAFASRVAAAHSHGAAKAACRLEILINTPAVANLIRQGKMTSWRTPCRAAAPPACGSWIPPSTADGTAHHHRQGGLQEVHQQVPIRAIPRRVLSESHHPAFVMA